MMSESMRSVFKSNIDHYEAAVKEYDEHESPGREHVNRLRCYFYIITAMREKIGCPACNSMKKCTCNVISGVHKVVQWSESDERYPRILW